MKAHEYVQGPLGSQCDAVEKSILNNYVWPRCDLYGLSKACTLTHSYIIHNTIYITGK